MSRYEDAEQYAVFHFSAVRMVDPEPDEGDPRSLSASMFNQPTLQPCNSQGQRLFRVNWFYKDLDTAMAVKVPAKRGQLDSKQRVIKLRPGAPVEASLPADFDPQHDWYYSQIHTQRCITNEDCYLDLSPWSEEALMEEEGLEAISKLRQGPSATALTRGRQPKAAQADRKLLVLDIFCGAGGLSFLEHRAGAPSGAALLERHGAGGAVGIHSRWAVDLNASAIETYRANHGAAIDAFCMGLEEFVMMLKHFKDLVDKVLPARAAGGDAAALEAIISGGGDGGSDDEDDEVDRAMNPRCWLELLVRRAGAEAPVWVRTRDLLADARNKPAIARFVAQQRRDRTIPLPGDVHVVAGGPPCQGISGLNQHRLLVDVLKDPKNRLMTTYMRLVEFLEPNYILMEQIRQRVIIWGARSGQEQLPPFPAPTHKIMPHMAAKTLSDDTRRCYVTFTEDAPESKAHPMVVMGDVFGDLPPVHNFRLRESADYKCEPQAAFQAWMRRAPPPGTPSLAERAAAADRRMGPARRRLERWMRRVLEEGGEEALGLLVSDPAVRASKEADRAAGMQAVFTWIGKILAGELAASQADDGAGPLRDHRPLLCNADDWLRMVAVPRERGANYRSISGVVTHPDGARLEYMSLECMRRGGALPRMRPGSWHASSKTRRGNKLVPGLCPGGGCVHKPEDEEEAAAAAGAAAGASGAGGSEAAEGSEDEAAAGGARRGGGKKGGKKGGAAAAASADTKSGPKTHKRVDRYGSEDNGAWRGTRMEGCDAETLWLPTGDLACPRWCITYKKGKSNGRHGCFGRMWYDSVQTTVVGRAEPHNLQLLHPEQDRVVTVRENARCQMGNAVAPPVAAALGRCLLLAAAGAAPPGAAVIAAPDAEYDAVAAAARGAGITSWVEENGAPEDERTDIFGRFGDRSRLHLYPDYRARAPRRAAAGKGGGGEEEEEEDEEEGESDDGSDGGGTSGAGGGERRAASESGVEGGGDDGGGKKRAAAAGGGGGAPAAKRAKGAAAAAGRPPRAPKAAAGAPRPLRAAPPPPPSARPRRGAAAKAMDAIARDLGVYHEEQLPGSFRGAEAAAAAEEDEEEGSESEVLSAGAGRRRGGGTPGRKAPPARGAAREAATDEEEEVEGSGAAAAAEEEEEGGAMDVDEEEASGEAGAGAAAAESGGGSEPGSGTEEEEEEEESGSGSGSASASAEEEGSDEGDGGEGAGGKAPAAAAAARVGDPKGAAPLSSGGSGSGSDDDDDEEAEEEEEEEEAASAEDGEEEEEEGSSGSGQAAAASAGGDEDGCGTERASGGAAAAAGGSEGGDADSWGTGDSEEDV
ncbi:MAG: hypothetical protein J3K34DRAFT_495628 [Monoraphidium minutum]|nr:MAG: hypothetical protein J3K34DRAFT_495628 [Monoraphidium minutum]